MIISYKDFLSENIKSTEPIIVYHISASLDHMLKSDFRLEYADDVSLFGHAIYFSSSPDIIYRPKSEGKWYCCKFSIRLDEPVLDMNKEIPYYEANQLLKDFNILYKTGIRYKWRENIQYGDFFGKITEMSLWEHNVHFRNFIQKHLGYNSFKYYQSSWTDFLTKKGDYGTSYGLYNPKNIKYIDGPF